MTIFKFDDTKDFDKNLEDFLDHMCTGNVEMGAILRTHISKLKGASDDALRRAARTDFNTSVKSALDDLLSVAEKDISL